MTKQEIEKLLARTDWQINILERTLNQEMESMNERAKIGNTSYVKATCEIIEQIRRELEVYKSNRAKRSRIENCKKRIVSKNEISKFVN